jgi:hypothetical protein
MTSPDGVTWTTRANFTGCDHPRLAATSGTFCIIESYYSATSTGNSWTSTNGASWAVHTASPTALAVGQSAPFFASTGTFVNIASYGTNISTSTNGSTWTARTGISGTYTQGVFGASLFIAITGVTAYQTSPTGVTWTSRTAPASLGAIGYGAQFVATSDDGTGTNLTSANGTTWTQYIGTPTLVSPTRSYFTPTFIIYGNGRYVAGGGSYGLYVSQPAGAVGVTWTRHTAPFAVGSVYGFAYGAGVYVLLDGSGHIYTSANGNTWTAHGTLTTVQEIMDLAFGNGIFVAVGQAGHTYTSPDGITWTTRATGGGANEIISQIIFDGTRFVAAHYDNVAATTWTRTSTDGITWTKGTVYSSMYFYGVAYGNGTYVAIESGGQSYTSTNALAWTYAGSASYAPSGRLRFVNGTFCYGPGSNGGGSAGGPLYVTSPDGVTWTTRVCDLSPSGSGSYCWDIAGAGDGRFVLASGYSPGDEAVYRTVDHVHFEARATGGDDWWGAVAYVNNRFFLFSWPTTTYLTSP